MLGVVGEAGERKREVLYTMPLKKNALGPSEAACIEQYKVVTKEDGGWLVTLFVTTPKVSMLQFAATPNISVLCFVAAPGTACSVTAAIVSMLGFAPNTAPSVSTEALDAVS